MRTNLIYALRNIKKNAISSFISVIGLAIAIACCLWIYFYVSQEYSYNNFFSNTDRIFRINYELDYVDGPEQDIRVEPELADLLMQNVPQIEKSTEFRSAFSQLLQHEEEFFETEMSYADREFFDVFSFRFLAGDRENVFRSPEEIVITKVLADKLLRQKNKDYSQLIGQSIEFPLAYGNKQFQITAVLDNMPRNSSIRRFEGIIPGENGDNFGGCNNDLGYTSVFFLTKENAHVNSAKNEVIKQLHNYYDDRIQHLINNREVINSPDAFTPFITSLKEGYFRDNIQTCSEISSSRRGLTILISIGILILLIACSNYTILSLGQAQKKMSEVGVRKAMGARKSNIFAIFFSEGLVLSVIAFILGALLCLFIVQNVNRIAEIEIFTELIRIPGIILFVILAFLTIVVFTSTIPVLVFSNINPNQLLGKKQSAGKKGMLSQLFVSFQYSLSVILIIVTISIIRQSNYLKNKSLGISTENIINFNTSNIPEEERMLFRNLVEEHPGVINLTLTSRNFINGYSYTYVNKGNSEQILVWHFKVDEKYIPTLGLQLIYGKNFSFENIRPGDISMIVNKAFIVAFGIQDNPIGKRYRFGNTSFSIIGVVEDYYFRDCAQEQKPAMLFTRTDWGNGFYEMLLKFNPQQLSEVIKHVKKCHSKVAPGTEINYTFWNEELAKRYPNEERWSKIVGLAAIIAILISSLGLFGLTILLINQRIKEIGIRKVNGARSIEILITINKPFVTWILASIAIASPLAYYIVKIWLKNYPYRISIGWWVFFLAGLITIGIALLTVSWQSWRAARKNPVEALRYE